MTYIFTNEECSEIVDLVLNEEWMGADAKEHVQKLERKLGKKVVPWCGMGEAHL